VLRRVIPAIAPPRTCPCPSLLASAVITAPDAVPPATRKKLALFLDKYSRRDPAPRKKTKRHG